ncbi:heavy metal-binding domain-containing protein [Mycobacteroides chelonae]|uniref:Heavy metal-binding domain-containing protein n=1 Tax=Mycobacteroides chelonae TaxID=1774 RepID=A0A1S1M237_MYCCH|nr:heavy metal-binding domain-containing protein [Mycobacteroides chelonae]OHU79134.1 heavy metal-binding domain-containing protein [Mycobacteroides chelonae]QQG89862.1 heavy-metal-associated domain-containing protein [Mycobacteroides chelonae]QQG94681.1 heavy-metal-associated domain-containing protein [Mycobacteroides chelonae]
MNAAGRLAVFTAVLGVGFGCAFAVAAAVVPENAVQSWSTTRHMAEGNTMNGHGASAEHGSADGLQGLSLSRDGYVLAAVEAPATAGKPGDLRLKILGADGAPVVDFADTHQKQLHLIVVRSDGENFRHVHPSLDTATGIWTVPWTWDAAGSYRVFVDFRPGDRSGTGQMTLGRTVEVAGDFAPVRSSSARTVDHVAGFTVELRGELVAGATEELTMTVTRDGHPVTTLQPYLGAFGHLIALRDGDLAFLHVHPEGAEPAANQHGGPSISFAANAPTAGRYLLYLDFQVEGKVHTARFIVDASKRDGTAQPSETHGHAHAGGH